MKDLVSLSEAFMTPKEKILKQKIIEYLIDDGHGHHHAKYAERFKDFFVNIVSLDEDPNFTAAVDFNEGIIYVGEGYIADRDLFHQISVLMRHELAHSLLMHQSRMMRVFKNKYGNNLAKHLKWDSKVHSLLNIIEDLEISNRVYTDEDKWIIRNMKSILQSTCGLITEDIRGQWTKLTVEQMYDELTKELEENEKRVMSLSGEEEAEWILSQDENDDFITSNLKTLYHYKVESKFSTINMPLQDFIEKSKTYPQMPDTLKEITNKVREYETKHDCTQDAEKKTVRGFIDQIKNSRPFTEVKLPFISLYTPLEKGFAIDLLKNIIGEVDKNKYKITLKRKEHPKEYKEMYNKIMKRLAYGYDQIPTAVLYLLLGKNFLDQSQSLSDADVDQLNDLVNKTDELKDLADKNAD